jgi:glycosyltransferase involved in cell wall biosynthesis
MRVLVYLHSFEAGGVERVALRLAGEWAERGHDVRLAMGRDTGAQRHHAPPNLIYDFARPSRLAAPFETLWMVAHLLAAIRRHRPDVLFCAGSTYTIVAILVRLILGRDCPPTVCKLSNSLERRDLSAPARGAFGLWLRFHRPFIDRFVGMAEPMRDEIERCLGVDAERIAIVPDPALKVSELELLASTARENGPARRFVAIGRMNAQKNFSLLLRAFADFAGPDDRLVIVGDGPQRRRLFRLAERLRIDDRVEMTGHVHSVAEALSAADVFVLSSDYEGVPAVIVEALAAGVPIVATDCSASMNFLLDNGRLGRLIPVRDRAALASAMRDAPSRGSVPAAEMQAKAAQFTIELAAGAYLNILESVAREWQAARVYAWPQPAARFSADAMSAMRSSGSSSPICSRTRFEAGGLDTVL